MLYFIATRSTGGDAEQQGRRSERPNANVFFDRSGATAGPA
jgi:hypothetical protein